MITKFLDPKNDFAFKKVFGTEKNKDILIQFLNDILDHQYIGQIQDVQFLPTMQVPDIAAKKDSIVDVLCTDQNGAQYIIEMQVAKTAGFEKRAQYYAAKAYSSQLLKGEEYSQLREVVFVAITDFEMFPGKSGVKSDHIILDKQTHAHDLRDLYFTFIELPKFQKGVDELDTLMEKWYYYLSHASETTKAEYERLVLDAPMLRRAYDELESCSWSDLELNTYEQVKKRELDNAAALRYKLQEARQEGIAIGKEEGMSIGEERGVKKGKQEGITIGEEKGMAIGKEEGIAIGKQEGIAKGIAIGEETTKQSLARQMLADGESIEKIQKWTGLSAEAIRQM